MTMLESLYFYNFFIYLMFISLLFINVVIFLYKGFALHTIAKKLNSKSAYLAWIPFLRFFLYPILAKKKWGWALIPVLLIILPILFMPFKIIPFINIFLIILIIIGIILFFIFRTYWIWKIFQRRNYNGALSLLTLINIGFLIVIGFVAWKDNNLKTEIFKNKKKNLKK
jgi:hypothetical protein